MRGHRPDRSCAVRSSPNCCTSSAPNEETPTSVTHTGLAVTAWISAILSGQAESGHRFQSSGKPCTPIASTASSAPCPSIRRSHCGSIGDMPPSTRVTAGLACAMAVPARIT